MLMLCPICSGDFQQTEPLCPACGCGLVPASIVVEPKLQSDRQVGEALVELCRPRLYSVAMLIKQPLEQNGVAAIIPGANSFAIMPHLSFSGEMRVMVFADQLDYAREIYAAYFQGDGETNYNDEP